METEIGLGRVENKQATEDRQRRSLTIAPPGAARGPCRFWPGLRHLLLQRQEGANLCEERLSRTYRR